MTEDPRKVRYLSLFDSFRCVSRHPRIGNGILTADARDMTGDRDKFKSLVIKDGATVTFGGNQSGKITGVGEVVPVKEVIWWKVSVTTF